MLTKDNVVKMPEETWNGRIRMATEADVEAEIERRTVQLNAEWEARFQRTRKVIADTFREMKGQLNGR